MFLTIRFYILLLLALLSFTTTGVADDVVLSEQQLKSAVVFNIARYVTWPSSPLHSNDHFVIGVFSQSRNISTWNLLTGKNMQGKKIVVRRVTDLDDLTACQLVIIDQSERKNMARALATLKESPTLTLSEIDGFSSAGGMITLHLVNNRMTFAINLKQSRAANLTISSNILKLATEVIQ